MNKILLLLLFSLVIGISTAGAVSSVGVLATPEAASATLSIEKVEAELELNGLFNSSLNIGVDYKLFEKSFNISEASGFFFNTGIGPALAVRDNFLGIYIIVPVEFGYNIPQPLDGKFDVYFQGKPVAQIIPNLKISFQIGLGVRYKI